MKMRKIAVLLLSTILLGCRFNTSIDEIDEEESAVIEVSIKDNAVKTARTAVPVIGEGETISYSVMATNGIETVGPVTQKVAGSDVYQLAVTPGEWVVNVTGTSDITNEDILFGTRTIRVSDSGKYGATVTMQFITGTGIKGAVDLTITINTTHYAIDKMIISGTGTDLDTDYPNNSGTIKINKTDIPSGDYNPILKFYDINNNLICVLRERISVRKNRTTKTWIKNGTEIWLKDDGSGNIEFNLTENNISSINSQTYFVKGTGGTLTATASDENPGTWAAPFKTLQTAVNKIMAVSYGVSGYYIYIDGEIKDETPNPDTDFITFGGSAAFQMVGFNGNTDVDIINANKTLANAGTGRFMKVTGTAGATFDHLTITGGYTKGDNSTIDINTNTTVSFDNCVVKNNFLHNSGATESAVIYKRKGSLYIKSSTITDNAIYNTYPNHGVLKTGEVHLSGINFIKNNYEIDNNGTRTNGLKGFYVDTANQLIIDKNIAGSEIELYIAKDIKPNENLIFTKKYSQTGTTEPPSAIFKAVYTNMSSQNVAYTVGWDSTGKEALVTTSSYTPTIQMHEDLEIRCLKSKVINPIDCGKSGRTVEFRLYSKTTGEDLTNAAGTNLTIKPKYLGSVLPAAYCSVNGNKCTFAANIPYEIFNITAIATAHGTTVSTTHNVQVVEIPRASTMENSIPADTSVIALADINDLNKVKTWIEAGASAQSYELILQNDFTIQDFETIDVGAANAYSGTLDGNGHSITMNTTDGNDSYGGIFGCIGAATVKNLTLKGSLTKNGGVGAVGALADTTGSNAVTIQYCENHVNITNNSTGTNSYTGGFIGSGTANITHCKNYGNITGNYLAGGFIGNGKNVGMISNCVNEGEIHASTTNPDAVAGSIIANISMSTTYSIYNCVNKGTVEAYSAGGIAYDASKVINCSNYGSVIGINNVSGILGYSINPTVKNCLNAGEISTANKRGAILANWGGNSTIVNNFYLKNADSLTGIGNGSNDISSTCAFTSNGSTSSTVEPITVSSTKYTDVVYLLNNWVNTNTPPAGAPAYSKWTYDSNGLPKLMCEE